MYSGSSNNFGMHAKAAYQPARPGTLPNALCCLPGTHPHVPRCAAYLAMISGNISRMLEGRALRFLGRPTRPGGKEMVSPCSNTLLALPMVALTPVLASPKPVLATFFTPSCTQHAILQSAFGFCTCQLCGWLH